MKKITTAAAALILSAGLAIAQTPSGETPAQGGAPNSNNPNAPAAQPDGARARTGVPAQPSRAQEPMSGNTGQSGRTAPTAPPDPAGDPMKKGPAPANTPGG